MIINVLTVLKDIEGNDLTYQDVKAQSAEIDKPMTVRYVLYNVLNNFQQGENPTEAEKEKCFDLSLRIYQQTDVDISKDEVKFIKERAGKIALPLVYGRLCQLLEQPDLSQVPQ